MYEKGQKLAIRNRNGGEEEVVLVEDIIADEEGMKLKVRSPKTHHTRIVNPQEQQIVEQLED